jgi:hypothetical protein
MDLKHKTELCVVFQINLLKAKFGKLYGRNSTSKLSHSVNILGIGVTFSFALRWLQSSSPWVDMLVIIRCTDYYCIVQCEPLTNTLKWKLETFGNLCNRAPVWLQHEPYSVATSLQRVFPAFRSQSNDCRTFIKKTESKDQLHRQWSLRLLPFSLDSKYILKGNINFSKATKNFH